MINVHLLTIYKKFFYYCQEVYIGQCKNIYFLQYHNGNGRGLPRRYWKIPTLSFEVANAPLVRRLRLRTSGRHWQPLRMRWVFSNTSSPGLCQCPIVGWYIFFLTFERKRRTFLGSEFLGGKRGN